MGSEQPRCACSVQRVTSRAISVRYKYLLAHVGRHESPGSANRQITAVRSRAPPRTSISGLGSGFESMAAHKTPGQGPVLSQQDSQGHREVVCWPHARADTEPWCAFNRSLAEAALYNHPLTRPASACTAGRQAHPQRRHDEHAANHHPGGWHPAGRAGCDPATDSDRVHRRCKRLAQQGDLDFRVALGQGRMLACCLQLAEHLCEPGLNFGASLARPLQAGLGGPGGVDRLGRRGVGFGPRCFRAAWACSARLALAVAAANCSATFSGDRVDCASAAPGSDLVRNSSTRV